MHFNWNGVVVTKTTPGRLVEPGTSYRGPAYGDQWPLEDVVEGSTIPSTILRTRKREKELCDIVFNTLNWGTNVDGSSMPMVISSVDLIDEYVQLCRKHDIAVRTVLCATDSPMPVMEDSAVEWVLQYARFLGYDFTSCCYSALHEGLYLAPTPELRRLATKQNAVGLLDDLADIEEFIQARKHCLALGSCPLEPVGGFRPCAVYEVDWPESASGDQ